MWIGGFCVYYSKLLNMSYNKVICFIGFFYIRKINGRNIRFKKNYYSY